MFKQLILRSQRLHSWLRICRRFIGCLLGHDVYIRPTLNVVTERHGSEYGGWTILKDSLTSRATVISAGLGHDITFDRSIIEKYGCQIHGFDPDPRAFAYHAEVDLPGGLIWTRAGIGAKAGKLKFYRPSNANWISGTFVSGAIAHCSDFDMVEVLDVASVLNSFPCGVDLFKMDVEGAEYEIVERLINSGVISRIRQLLVEFHHGKRFRGRETRRAVNLILAQSFELFHVSELGCEFAFCRPPTKKYPIQ